MTSVGHGGTIFVLSILSEKKLNQEKCEKKQGVKNIFC